MPNHPLPQTNKIDPRIILLKPEVNLIAIPPPLVVIPLFNVLADDNDPDIELINTITYHNKTNQRLH